MDCLHCGKAFHAQWDSRWLVERFSEKQQSWKAEYTICPACNEPIIVLIHGPTRGDMSSAFLKGQDKSFVAHPRHKYRKPTPASVPPGIKDDYEEACAVLAVSEKASAALSRRCLQAILRAHGFAQHDLVKQIDAALVGGNLPSGLHETIDAIRQFGNFSAHPITDQTTLQIVAVDAHEAEWCLDILEEMFDHFYVKPALAAQRKAALNAKLSAAGKPPAK